MNARIVFKELLAFDVFVSKGVYVLVGAIQVMIAVAFHSNGHHLDEVISGPTIHNGVEKSLQRDYQALWKIVQLYTCIIVNASSKIED